MVSYFGIEKLKEGSNVGHFVKGSKFTENKVLVSVRRPEDITILGAFAESRKKATISFVISACQFARPREMDRFPVDGLLRYFTLILKFCRES